jgi:replicative DNA helicase
MQERIERIRPSEGPERLPPNNIPAEDAVLGCILVDRSVLPRLLPLLEARDFFQERASSVWRAIVALAERDEPINFISISDELSASLSDVGAQRLMSYLSGLLMEVPNTLDAESFARAVAKAAAMRRLVSAGGRIAAIGFLNEVDPEPALEEAERLLGDVLERQAQTDFLSAEKLSSDYIDEIAALRSGEAISGVISTGLPDLDRKLSGGWVRGNLVVIGARPSMGKTAVGLNLALAASRANLTTAMFSMEMASQQIAERLVATASGLAPRLLRSAAELTPEQTQALAAGLGTVASSGIFVDDTPNLSAKNLRARIKRFVQSQPWTSWSSTTSS